MPLTIAALCLFMTRPGLYDRLAMLFVPQRGIGLDVSVVVQCCSLDCLLRFEYVPKTYREGRMGWRGMGWGGAWVAWVGLGWVGLGGVGGVGSGVLFWAVFKREQFDDSVPMGDFDN